MNVVPAIAFYFLSILCIVLCTVFFVWTAEERVISAARKSVICVLLMVGALTAIAAVGDRILQKVNMPWLLLFASILLTVTVFIMMVWSAGSSSSSSLKTSRHRGEDPWELIEQYVRASQSIVITEALPTKLDIGDKLVRLGDRAVPALRSTCLELTRSGRQCHDFS